MVFTFSLLLAATLSSQVTTGDFERGLELTYRGDFMPVKEAPSEATKRFTFNLLLATPNGEELQWCWRISEEGPGSPTWLNQFGVAPRNNHWHKVKAPPILVYTRPDVDKRVVLSPVEFVDVGKLSEDAEWTTNGLLHKVTPSVEKVADREAYRIDISGRYGRVRTGWVARNNGLLLRLDEVVFIGQGEEHRLRYELDSVRKANDEAITNTEFVFASLLTLKNKLEETAKDDQAALVKQELRPLLERANENTHLARFLRSALTETENARHSEGALLELQKRAIGKPLPEFSLSGFGDDVYNNVNARGKVVVLHFWDYQRDPIREPYGQVGYLDFLARRLRASDHSAECEVIGVCVHKLLASDIPKAKANAKKLVAFMNLSYAVTFDTSDLLSQIGDPRKVGGELPLTVVVGSDGKLRHYHAGNYKIERSEGLQALNKAIEKALPKN